MGGGARRAAVWLSLTAIGLFVIQSAWKALRAPWLVDDFPEALYVKTELLPWTFPAHMISGGLALLLVPAMILLSSQPRWHRRLAWVTVPVVVLAGITAFPVALVAPVTPISAWGFTVQGALWLGLLGAGVWFIRHGQVARHRAAMLLLAAVTSGAMFFRIFLALFAIYGHPRDYQAFYAADAWAAWGLPLIAMAIFLKRTGAKAADPR